MKQPFRLAAAGLLSALSACHSPTAQSPAPDAQAEQVPPRPPGAILSREHDGQLYFDERYLDTASLQPPAKWSPRMRREMAIQRQLNRLWMAEDRYFPGEPKPRPTDSVAVGETPVFGKAGDTLTGVPDRTITYQAWWTEIYHAIDSLKVAEGLPLTPHSFLTQP